MIRCTLSLTNAIAAYSPIVEKGRRETYLRIVLPIVVWLALLCAGLVLAAILRTRQAFGIFRSIAGTMDRSTKRVGLVSLAPGIATAAWLARRGVDPPAAVIVGTLCAF